MVLNNRGSGIRSALPFEPEPIGMGRFRVGLFSVLGDNRNPEPVHSVQQEGTKNLIFREDKLKHTRHISSQPKQSQESFR
jgi:hypothetical protein